MSTPKVRPLHVALAALVLLVGTLGLYAPVRGHEFVDYDDGSYVTKNPDVLAGLTGESVVWAFTHTHSSNWHPLTWMSHMLDVELFGLDAGKHHLVNALLHGLNAGLLLAALCALTRRFWPCVVVAALFAVHPLRVESVAWVAERKDVLSATFFFLALWAHALQARSPQASRMFLVLLAMFLGLLAKPMLVTLPFVLLLLDRWPLRRRLPFSELAREKLPLFILAAASCVVTVIAQSLGDALRSVESLPLDIRSANALVAYAAYLGQTLWPAGLTVFYPHPALVDVESYDVTGTRVLAAASLCVALTAVAVLQRRQRPWLLVGWLWFVGMLIPVIGIVQVGAQWMADRYTYLPLIGITIALVWTVDERVRTRSARKAAVAIGLLAAAVLVPITHLQLRTWKDTRSLFEHALVVTEGNYVAHINLGFMEHRLGDLDAAQAHYEAALAITPTMVDALSDLGGLHWQRGEYDRARELLERALEQNPDFTKAWLNLGLVYRSTERPDEALEAFRAAVAADPASAEARIVLAEVLRARGQAREALPVVQEAVARHPQDEDARIALAQTLVDLGRRSEALRHLRRFDRAEAPPLAGLELLGWIFATSADPDLRDPAEAMRIAQRCMELAPSAWTTQRLTAAALAADGRFEEAASLALEAAVSATAQRAPAERQQELMDLSSRFRAREALAE